MSEIFPIVSPEGQVIGQASRAHCHDGSHPLHPVVHLHVFLPTGELYLQRRAMHKGLLPGYWDTAVGGHVCFGETIEQALAREVAEEIGITDYMPEHVETYRYDSDRESEMVHVFRTTYAGSFSWNDGEVMDGKFWSKAELREAMGKNILTPNLEMELQRFGFI